MKYILIIGDGMADVKLPQLGGKTPLEAADIPMMDYLAKNGTLGSVVNCPEGLPPGSDTAILTLFGCDPKKYYFGRAPLEAAAQGLTLSEGDLAFRCNMATIDDTDLPFAERKILSHSAGSIDGEIAEILARDLFFDPEFKVAAEKAGITLYPTRSYRHIAVQKCGDGTGLILKAPHDHLYEAVGINLPSGNANAVVLSELMELSNAVLNRHPMNIKRKAEGLLPANCAWFWAQGTAAKLPSFEERYGKEGAVISAVPLCHGIALLQGLERIIVPGATGELHTNYEGKAEAAQNALNGGADFIAVHIEAPDECTHEGDIDGKIQAIENIDKRTLKPLIEAFQRSNADYRIMVLSDHKTLSTTGAHDAAPVPFILYDSRNNAGCGLAYNEDNGLKGKYLETGLGLMEMLFSDDDAQ